MNIIQRSSLPIYQQLSTFLLQTYRAKYLLQRIPPSSILRLTDPRLRQQAYKLRHRLIWLADTLRAYLSETVIAPSFTAMTTAITRAEDIDEMSSLHMRYVARLQEQALLSDNLRPIHRAIIALLDLAVLFSNSLSEARDKTKPSKPMDPPKKSTRHRPSTAGSETADDRDVSDSSNAGDDEDSGEVGEERGKGLATVEGEFERLLPFVRAGLRSVGRVGAEGVWEVLAERLEWWGGGREGR